MPEKKLSEREAACLQWAAAGKTSRETALILGVSERTVNFHVQNACRKLHARNRRAAVAMALTCGLLAARRTGRPSG
jgi:DNA-binding CsgD family transcriptional regulator